MQYRNSISVSELMDLMGSADTADPSIQRAKELLAVRPKDDAVSLHEVDNGHILAIYLRRIRRIRRLGLPSPVLGDSELVAALSEATERASAMGALSIERWEVIGVFEVNRAATGRSWLPTIVRSG